MYKVELSAIAAKELKNLARADMSIYRRIVAAIQDLAQNPLSGKALIGPLKGYYSFRVGVWRIIYTIYHGKLLISVVDIGHRRDIYR